MALSPRPKAEEERSVVVDVIAPKESVASLADEWKAEIARRAALVRSGQSQGKPADGMVYAETVHILAYMHSTTKIRILAGADADVIVMSKTPRLVERLRVSQRPCVPSKPSLTQLFRSPLANGLRWSCVWRKVSTTSTMLTPKTLGPRRCRGASRSSRPVVRSSWLRSYLVIVGVTMSL